MSLFLIDIGEGVNLVFVHIPKTGGRAVRHGCQLSGYRLTKPDDEWRGLRSFAFIRNPFDRLESCWRDFRYTRVRTSLAFEDFIQYVNDTCDMGSDVTTMQHHTLPMVDSLHGLQHAGFIGRYDRLQRDYNKFRSMVGVKRKTLPIVGQSDLSAPYAVKSRLATRLLEKFYADDYNLWETRNVN